MAGGVKSPVLKSAKSSKKHTFPNFASNRKIS